MTASSENVLEIYKTYADLVDKAMGRRKRINRFYILLHTGILLFAAGLLMLGGIGRGLYSLVIIGVLGLSLCLLWYFNLVSFRKGNSRKFSVLQQMAEELGYTFPETERNLQYQQLPGQLERMAPMLMSAPYLVIFALRISLFF